MIIVLMDVTVFHSLYQSDETDEDDDGSVSSVGHQNPMRYQCTNAVFKNTIPSDDALSIASEFSIDFGLLLLRSVENVVVGFLTCLD